MRNGGAEHGVLDAHDFTPVRRESVPTRPGAALVEVQIGFADEAAEAEAAERERRSRPVELSRTPAAPRVPGAARELLGRIARVVSSEAAPAADLTAPPAPLPKTTVSTAPAADPRPNHPAALPVSPVLPGRRFIAGMKADQLRRDHEAAPREDTDELMAQYVRRFEERPPRKAW